MRDAACVELRAPPPRIVETHVSTLFFSHDRVYKMKKPVRYDFLDFSTPEARRRACEREVELNKRLAPDVYLGTATILDGTGRPCEHLVVMRRLPAERRLATLVRTNDLSLPDQLRRVAHAVAAFHERAACTNETSRAASRIVVRKRWDDNLREMRSMAPGDALDRIAHLAHRYLDGRGPLFSSRAEHRKGRDGHGDLLAEDIFCLDDGPRILDCLEFDDDLRAGDVLSDAAFLAMDLERLGAPRSADRFLALYHEFSGDGYPQSLADHYVAYRALIRSKIAFLKRSQHVTDVDEEAEPLLALARNRLRRARVRLVLAGGGPGTGKSTIADALATRLGWALLSSDELRKDLARLPHRTRAIAPLDGGIYAPALTHATYRELLRRAKLLLELGESVVIDATWSDARQRAAAAQIALDTSSDLIELRCEAAPDVVERRLRTRAPGASDATPELARAIAARADAWPEAVTLDTGDGLQETLRAAFDAVTGYEGESTDSPSRRAFSFAVR